MSYKNNHNINVLNGRTIVNVSGLEAGSDEVAFVCSDGSAWRMVHVQDCCESVSVAEVIGDVSDLIGAVVIEAREDTNNDDPPSGEYQPDSFTWTFYTIQTSKGAVTIRWLGESNGYYSESVDFELTSSPFTPASAASN